MKHLLLSQRVDRGYHLIEHDIDFSVFIELMHY